MDFLHWQQTDKNKFAVFIRDLSHNLNNVKHMIEDSFKEDTKPKHNQKKKVVKKKKDIIIEQQTKLRQAKQIKEDLDQLDYIMETLDPKNPYISFRLMRSEEGLLQLKYRMLQYFWERKKDYFPHVMNLYFQLVKYKESNESNKELLQKIQMKLDDTEYKLYMMKNLSHLLPPLNIHEPKVKKLDDWQLQVITHIKLGESVVVKAPTSSGKSFVALSAGILHKKLLYVCPAKPIAYQVGAHFSSMGYKVHYLVDNLCHHSYDDKTNIFVGVPQSIEDNLYKIGTTFDYAVFDEIHNLNKEDDGHIYENIIKLIQCPFLALSATIGNIDYLKDIFYKIHNHEIHYIEYTKRFINQQKMIYDKGLHKLHPLACIEFEDLNENFLQQNLQFTPYDSAVLWETIEETFDSDDEDVIEDLSPDNYFDDDNSILTLDDTRDYEYFIKSKLVELSKSHSDQVKEILSKFHRGLKEQTITDHNKDIIQLFRECKGAECLPMLAFNTDTLVCKRLFTSLFEEIGKSELEEYPYHYDILEKKEELYIKYEEDRSKFIEGIKIGKESKDARTDKQTKVDRFDRQQQQKYELAVQQYYQQCIHNCTRNDELCDKIKKKQLKNLTKELKEYQKYPTFGRIDIFQKHKEFCFSNTEPMTGDQIREVRREIKKTLGLKISYEHELFQMLKRGIGIYTEDMPEEYKWILQKLMDDKKIGIVISDRTLCLGIDLPIRSSLLMGLPDSSQFTIDDYLQMSGRAGRRGKDDRGYTIFYNLDYKQLMKGCLPNIVGSDKAIPSNYQSLNTSIDEVYKNSIHMSKEEDTHEYQKSSDPKLQWNLRYEDNVCEFIEGITKWNKEVFNSVEKEECVLTKVVMILPYDKDTIIRSYKKKVIEKEFHECKHLCKLLQTIYNSLKDKKYIHLKGIIKLVHSTLKDMILRYQGLN